VRQGFVPAEVLTVRVGSDGGPEAAAREARYSAFGEAAERLGATAVLLGHTRDDQAETVLLGMARGSGARAVAGMAPRRGRYLRPLLEVSRHVVARACVDEGLEPWQDPHNADPAYARARVRELLPALEAAAGPGTIAGLSRTARMVRADADYLDELAAVLAVTVTAADLTLDAVALASSPMVLRCRVLHSWAKLVGAPPGALSATQVEALDALVADWRGQGPVYLPGALKVSRTAGRLAATPRPPRGS
jgi:tRNA(Ile)-lysidine synthase